MHVNNSGVLWPSVGGQLLCGCSFVSADVLHCLGYLTAAFLGEYIIIVVDVTVLRFF